MLRAFSRGEDFRNVKFEIVVESHHGFFVILEEQLQLAAQVFQDSCDCGDLGRRQRPRFGSLLFSEIFCLL